MILRRKAFCESLGMICGLPSAKRWYLVKQPDRLAVQNRVGKWAEGNSYTQQKFMNACGLVLERQ